MKCQWGKSVDVLELGDTVDVGSTLEWLGKAIRVSMVLPVSTQSQHLIKRSSRISNVGFANLG